MRKQFGKLKNLKEAAYSNRKEILFLGGPRGDERCHARILNYLPKYHGKWEGRVKQGRTTYDIFQAEHNAMFDQFNYIAVPEELSDQWKGPREPSDNELSHKTVRSLKSGDVLVDEPSGLEIKIDNVVDSERGILVDAKVLRSDDHAMQVGTKIFREPTSKFYGMTIQKSANESLTEAADAGGVYIGNLDRFGYTLVCAGRTPQEVKASLIKEYKKAYRQRNNSMPDEDELRWADEEITPTFHKFGYVEWE